LKKKMQKDVQISAQAPLETLLLAKIETARG
jgi:hypothetical protein